MSSPDRSNLLNGGDGSMEILIIVVLVALAVGGAVRLATK
jgi:hypothetical protein